MRKLLSNLITAMMLIASVNANAQTYCKMATPLLFNRPAIIGYATSQALRSIERINEQRPHYYTNPLCIPTITQERMGFYKKQRTKLDSIAATKPFSKTGRTKSRLKSTK